jgi:hypothetical protein
MSKHREIDCPACPGPVCELDGDGPNPQPETVHVVLIQGKHISPLEAASAFKTHDAAARSVSTYILEDVQDGRYADNADLASALAIAIEAEDWEKMFELHESYWESFWEPEIIVIHECPVG